MQEEVDKGASVQGQVGDAATRDAEKAAVDCLETGRETESCTKNENENREEGQGEIADEAVQVAPSLLPCVIDVRYMLLTQAVLQPGGRRAGSDCVDMSQVQPDSMP
eukprot:2957385-Rhodomonas_salina.4